MRVGVFGGSFDPIHHAHLIVAQLAREQLGLDLVRFVVTGLQPHKPAGHAAPPADRAAMVEQAVAGMAGMMVDRQEVERPGPSFTVETLQQLHRELPGVELVLLLGADAAARFETWRDPGEIRRLAQVAVFQRGREAPPEGFDATVEVPVMELSATVIRARARAGLPLAGWVPTPVADYIARRRLYGSG